MIGILEAFSLSPTRIWIHLLYISSLFLYGLAALLTQLLLSLFLIEWLCQTSLRCPLQSRSSFVRSAGTDLLSSYGDRTEVITVYEKGFVIKVLIGAQSNHAEN